MTNDVANTAGDSVTNVAMAAQGASPSSLAERRAALRERFPVWTPRTLSSFVHDSAATFGDRPLVITDEQTLSYAQTARWADEFADGLHALGVQHGDHVGLIVANFLEFLPLKFAIAEVGAVAIPMNFLYREQELAYVLAQSDCNFLVTMTGFSGLNYLQMLDSIAPGWDSSPEPKIAEFPKLRRIIQFNTNGEPRDGVLDIDAVRALGQRNQGGASAEGVTPETVADILYTSGTTGSPKGVMVTHDAVLRTGYASALTRAFEKDRRVLFSLPCYHMFGYVEGILGVMMSGGAFIPQTRFSAIGYLEAIQKHRATDILCVPTMTVAILECPERHNYDLTSLTAIMSASAPGPAWLWEQAKEELGASEIVTGYGMTESGGCMTLTRPEDAFQVTAATVGRPKNAGVAGLPDRGGDLTEYRAMDPFTGEPLPTGEVGELASRGPTNMVGYWKKPEETARTLREGWVYSGDLGRVRSDGYLELTGRTKELYKSGGELVMPREIEDVLCAHPGISQAYAVGVPNERWGEIGTVFVVRAPDSTLTEDDVIDLCREKLARFKVPKAAWFIDSDDLPLTPTGKVQKFRLTQRATTRMEQEA